MAVNPGYDVSVDTIFIQGLPEDTTESQLEEYFGQIGIIKLDRKNNCKKIWIYKDKTTGKGKGEATITYDDPPTATSAINWFNGKEFQGCPLKIELAQRKSNPLYASRGGGGGGFRGGPRGASGGGGGSYRGNDRGDRGGRPGGSGRPGDWMCPSCSNNNFAYRNECNRCRTQKPAGVGGEDTGRSSQYNSGSERGGGGRYHSDSRVNHGSRNGGGSNYRDNDARGSYHHQRDGNRDRSRDGSRDHNNRGHDSYRDRDDRNRSSYSGAEGGGPSRSVHRGSDRRQRPY